VTLVAVSKTMDATRIREAMAAGQVDFGENHAQELIAKFEETGPGPRWHFIGRMQRNKVGPVMERAFLIHSIDRAGLGREIDRHASEPVPVLVEVNTTGETTKGGVAPSLASGLIERLLEYPNVEVTGLMTIARRVVTDASEARQYFRRLAELAGTLAGRFPEAPIHHLSMGMSQDYEVAIEEGATIVRIGEAIFGPRMQTRTEN
jgi:PLP dependent protein